MPSSIQIWSNRLAKRPVFIAVLLLLFGILLGLRLVVFVQHTRGITTFEDFTPEQAAWVMRVVIALTWLWLALRLISINRKLRRDAIAGIRRADLSPARDAKDRIRNFVIELGIQGNPFKRLVRVIAWAPKPFLALTLVLSVANALLYTSYFVLRNSDGLWRSLVFPNCPWLIALLVVVYLVINDVWVFDELEQFIASLDSLAPAGRPNPESTAMEEGTMKCLAGFLQQLSHKEREVLWMRVLEQKSLKEIAAAGHKELSTVKTQINDINTKWRRHSVTTGMRDLSLKELSPYIRGINLNDSANYLS